jgi:hypothetical protein
VYIDLNMMRDGVVKYPLEWIFIGKWVLFEAEIALSSNHIRDHRMPSRVEMVKLNTSRYRQLGLHYLFGRFFPSVIILACRAIAQATVGAFRRFENSNNRAIGSGL